MKRTSPFVLHVIAVMKNFNQIKMSSYRVEALCIAINNERWTNLFISSTVSLFLVWDESTFSRANARRRFPCGYHFICLRTCCDSSVQFWMICVAMLSNNGCAFYYVVVRCQRPNVPNDRYFISISDSLINAKYDAPHRNNQHKVIIAGLRLAIGRVWVRRKSISKLLFTHVPIEYYESFQRWSRSIHSFNIVSVERHSHRWDMIDRAAINRIVNAGRLRRD